MDLSTTKLKRRARQTALLACLAFGPLAPACPLCSANRADQPPQSTRALLGTTAAMAMLPLGMVAGLVWWLRKNL